MFTRTTWSHIGGLPGMLLTMGDLKNTELLIRGDQKLKEMINSLSHFSHRDKMHHDFEELVFDKEIKEGPVTIIPIHVTSEKDDETSVGWLCKISPPAVKFDVDKAKELNIPEGPMYRTLKGGDSVVLKDGTCIEPSQVLKAGRESSAFLIADCPTVSHIDSLAYSPTLATCFTQWDAKVVFVVHMTPENVLNNEKYVEWMASFPPTVYHLVLNKSTASKPVFRWVGLKQSILRMVDDSIFPPHYYPPEKPPKLPLPNCVAAKPRMYYDFLRQGAFAFHQKVVTNYEETAARVFEIRDEKLKLLPASNDNYERHNDDDEDDNTEICFLGTGAAVPSRYRGVASIYASFEQSSGRTFGCLLDSGEGTFGQLFRMFGKEIDNIMLNLKLIWVSHLHADHHLGVIRVILERQKVLEKDPCSQALPLVVIGPSFVKHFLEDYSAKVESLNYIFVDARNFRADIPLNPKDRPEEARAVSTFLRQNGIEKFQAVAVDHCLEAYGIVITSDRGWKVAYSGDGRPSSELVTIGKNAHVLIHDATFDSDLVDLAIKKKHSTATEAVITGIAMDADVTMLTHFSQRYPRFPIVEERFENYAGVAFDLMRFKLRDRKRIPKLNGALKEACQAYPLHLNE